MVFAFGKLLRSSYQIRGCSGVNPFTDVMPARACDQEDGGEAGRAAGCAALERGSFAACPTPWGTVASFGETGSGPPLCLAGAVRPPRGGGSGVHSPHHLLPGPHLWGKKGPLEICVKCGPRPPTRPAGHPGAFWRSHCHRDSTRHGLALRSPVGCDRPLPHGSRVRLGARSDPCLLRQR